MKLFDILGGKVVIHADGLAIPCFRRLWEADSPDKKHSTDVISYIAFKHNWDSPYVLSTSPEELEPKLKTKVFGDVNYQLTPEEIECEKEYEGFNKTLTLSLLQSIRGRMWDQEEYYRTSKGDALDLATIEKMNKGVKELKGTLETLDTLEKAVKAGELNIKKVKGDKAVNPYELVR